MSNMEGIRQIKIICKTHYKEGSAENCKCPLAYSGHCLITSMWFPFEWDIPKLQAILNDNDPTLLGEEQDENAATKQIADRVVKFLGEQNGCEYEEDNE